MKMEDVKKIAMIGAGGTENMSQSVYFVRNARHGLGNGDHPLEDSLVQGGPGAIPTEIYGQQPMGNTAENLADRYRIPCRSARIAMVALGAEGVQGMALVLRNAD